MCGLKDIVAGGIYEKFLAAGEIAPQQEHYPFPIVGKVLYHCVREGLPPYPGMGTGKAGFDGEHGVEKQDSLTCPLL